MAKKRYYDESYAGRDERRRQEYEDSMMIKEDRGAIANLPKEVMMKEYPRVGYGMGEYLDDTARGIDRQISDDNREKKKEMHPEKY